MNNLTEEQIIKLIEENLDNKFKYYLDEMKDEKRPFGNSGSYAILKDMLEVADIKKTWTVNDSSELEDLQYDYMIECFREITDWISNNRENFRVKLDAKGRKNDG